MSSQQRHMGVYIKLARTTILLDIWKEYADAHSNQCSGSSKDGDRCQLPYGHPGECECIHTLKFAKMETWIQ